MKNDSSRIPHQSFGFCPKDLDVIDVMLGMIFLFYSRKPQYYNMDVSVVSGGDPETEYEVTLDLALIKLEISSAQAECSRRGLSQTAKWLAEISFAIRDVIQMDHHH